MHWDDSYLSAEQPKQTSGPVSSTPLNMNVPCEGKPLQVAPASKPILARKGKGNNPNPKKTTGKRKPKQEGRHALVEEIRRTLDELDGARDAQKETEEPSTPPVKPEIVLQHAGPPQDRGFQFIEFNRHLRRITDYKLHKDTIADLFMKIDMDDGLERAHTSLRGYFTRTRRWELEAENLGVEVYIQGEILTFSNVISTVRFMLLDLVFALVFFILTILFTCTFFPRQIEGVFYYASRFFICAPHLWRYRRRVGYLLRFLFTLGAYPISPSQYDHLTREEFKCVLAAAIRKRIAKEAFATPDLLDFREGGVNDATKSAFGKGLVVRNFGPNNFQQALRILATCKSAAARATKLRQVSGDMGLSVDEQYTLNQVFDNSF